MESPGAAGNSAGFRGVALHAAGGGELLINGRAGAGGEVGLLTNGSSILSITSINGVARLFGQSDRNSPFVTGGYSRFSSGPRPRKAAHVW